VRTQNFTVISQLDIITSPPLQDPYSKLRPQLLKRLVLSREQRARRILTLEEMDDRKLSQFLRHLRSLFPDLPDYFLLTTWTSRLPVKVQAILACHPEVELDAAADCADRIIESVLPPALATIGQPTDNSELLRRIEQLSRRVPALSAERDRPLSRDRRSSYGDRPSCSWDPHSYPRHRRPYNRSPPRRDALTTCWYHQRFGNRAYNCSQPCTYSQEVN
jgi:hypothetical protein